MPRTVATSQTRPYNSKQIPYLDFHWKSGLGDIWHVIFCQDSSKIKGPRKIPANIITFPQTQNESHNTFFAVSSRKKQVLYSRFQLTVETGKKIPRGISAWFTQMGSNDVSGPEAPCLDARLECLHSGILSWVYLQMPRHLLLSSIW